LFSSSAVHVFYHLIFRQKFHFVCRVQEQAMHSLNAVINGRLILRRVFYNKTLASGEGVAGSF